MSAIRLTEVASTPSDSASGQTQIYAKTDGKIYTKRADNAESSVQTGEDQVGKILSVQSKSSQDVTSFAADTWVTWDSDLDITITPTSSSSKFFISATTSGGSPTGGRVFIRFLRDSTPVGIGASSGSRTPASGGLYQGSGDFGTISPSYLDAPATASAITYHLQAYGSSGTSYLNRSPEDADGDSSIRGITTFTVMEIAG